MAQVEIRRFEDPDESRTFEHGSFALVTNDSVTVGRASYEPGWVWSEDVGKATPGDLFYVAPGHDSWVTGDEPYVSLHFLGATDYAKG